LVLELSFSLAWYSPPHFQIILKFNPKHKPPFHFYVDWLHNEY